MKKKELYFVLESSERAFSTLEEIKQAGFNATVVSSESLRHAVEYTPEDHHFLSLRHIEQNQLLQSILCLFVVDENRLEELKEVIRRCTNNFKDLKGFMYSRDILDYEGSI